MESSLNAYRTQKIHPLTNLTPTDARTSADKALRGNMFCVLAIALFATGFPAAEVLLSTWGSISLIAIRVVLACALLVPIWIMFDGYTKVIAAPWPRALAIGAIGFGVGMVLLLVVQDITDPVSAALIAATMPVSAVVLEMLFDGRKLTPNFAAGAVLVLVGGFIATGAELTDGAFGGALFLGCVASMMFAWGSRQAVKGLPDMSSLGQTTTTLVGAMLFCIATLAVFALMGWKGTHSAPLGPSGWSLLFVYAWGSMALSQAFWLLGVARLGIGIASFHLNASPFYVMLILLMAGGNWDWGRAFGAVLLGVGVLLSQRTRSVMHLSGPDVSRG